MGEKQPCRPAESSRAKSLMYKNQSTGADGVAGDTDRCRMTGVDECSGAAPIVQRSAGLF